jgi:arylsulfatase A-like enzyme
VLEALDRLDLTRNTLVVFTSDNGAHWLPREVEQYQHAAHGPWRGQKADIHEGGHRVPCLIRWPGRVKPGTASAQLACLTDFLATFAELTGTAPPEDAGEDSFSFAHLLLGQPATGRVRQSLVMHSAQGMFAIRRGGWKLIEGLGSGGFTAPARVNPKPGEPEAQLYELYTDPAERTNRAAADPEIAAALRRELTRIQQAGRSLD